MFNEESMPTIESAPPADADDLLTAMLGIRYFEDEVKALFGKNLVRGSTHLCQGQEAVTVGMSRALRNGDTMTCTYRGHGASLAHGAAMDRCFGEILGRANGLCGGRGGSMHFTDVSIGALGSNAIVGANLPLTVGAALSASILETGAVNVAYFGDGATNIGAFHESLNMASIWKLPAIFVIENNQYGEYSPVASTTPIERLSERGASYGMPGVFVDGNDVVAMRAVATEAVDRARAGDGPTLIEADTYRFEGHSRSDPGAYRPDGEFERWKQRDPITRLESAMTGQDPEATTRIDTLRTAVREAVVSARDRAISWPTPDADDWMRNVYA